MTPLTDNVLSVYRRAEFAAFSEGISWYHDAHEFANSIDSDTSRAAGIIAALSPMNRWENNKRKAEQLYSQGHGQGCGLYANVDKAMRIYNGAPALSVLGGDKVRAFYSSILDPNSLSAPVIDRHAFDVAVGVKTNDRAKSILKRKGEYMRFANVYSEAASIVGISSSQMQAITWVQWRFEHGLS